MIALLTASAITLAALQASINAPREAFKACLKEASSKASSEKIGSDAYETYVRNACSTQLGSFRSATIGFDMKNKMSKKDAAQDADMMIDDFLSSSLERYKYVTGGNSAPTQTATASSPAAATPPPTPAAAPKQ